MGTSYEEIRGFMDDSGLKYRMSDGDEYIITGFKTNNYVDSDGDDGLRVVIRLREDGEYFEVFAPMAYQYADGPNKLAVMQALMMVQWKTKLIQYEYDAKDGEIRPIIEFPLEDSRLTQRQFLRVLHGLVQLVDEYDPVVRKAIETGEIAFEDSDVEDIVRTLAGTTPEEVAQILAEIRRRRRGGAGPEEL